MIPIINIKNETGHITVDFTDCDTVIYNKIYIFDLCPIFGIS